MYNVKKPADIFDSFDSENETPRKKDLKNDTNPIFNQKKLK